MDRAREPREPTPPTPPRETTEEQLRREQAKTWDLEQRLTASSDELRVLRTQLDEQRREEQRHLDRERADRAMDEVLHRTREKQLTHQLEQTRVSAQAARSTLASHRETSSQVQTGAQDAVQQIEAALTQQTAALTSTNQKRAQTLDERERRIAEAGDKLDRVDSFRERIAELETKLRNSEQARQEAESSLTQQRAARSADQASAQVQEETVRKLEKRLRCHQSELDGRQRQAAAALETRGKGAPNPKASSGALWMVLLLFSLLIASLAALAL